MSINELQRVIKILREKQRNTLYAKDKSNYGIEIAKAEKMIKQIQSGARNQAGALTQSTEH